MKTFFFMFAATILLGQIFSEDLCIQYKWPHDPRLLPESTVNISLEGTWARRQWPDTGQGPKATETQRRGTHRPQTPRGGEAGGHAPKPRPRPRPRRRHFLPTGKQICGTGGAVHRVSFSSSRPISRADALSAGSSALPGPRGSYRPSRGEPRLIWRRSAAGAGPTPISGNLASREEGQTQGLCPVSQPSRAPPTLNNKTRAFLSPDWSAPPYSLESLSALEDAS